jgi:beta-phosphoglucomutase-like phosphatase (HAD superfamily)
VRLYTFAAVLLDMDGTLVDSETLWRVAEREFARRHGFSLEPSLQATFVGKEVISVMAFLKERFGLSGEIATLAEELETIVKGLLPEVKEQPGTTALIKLLITYNVPRAVVSNSTRAIIAKTLEKQPWANLVPQRFSADDVSKGKPEPDLYLLAAQMLNVLPQRCLVIEDSLPGAQAATRAGMTCCLLTHGEEKVATVTPLLFESLHGVLEWLQS